MKKSNAENAENIDKLKELGLTRPRKTSKKYNYELPKFYVLIICEDEPEQLRILNEVILKYKSVKCINI